MPYILQLDLENYLSLEKLRQLTDDTRDGNVDTAVVSKAIQDAEGTINGFLGSRYPVPIADSPTPDKLKSLSTAIASYRLFTRRSVLPPDDIRDLYRDAIDFLKMVAKGEAIIPGATAFAGTVQADRDFEKDRDFRKRWDGGPTDSSKAGTFGTFDDI